MKEAIFVQCDCCGRWLEVDAEANTDGLECIYCMTDLSEAARREKQAGRIHRLEERPDRPAVRDLRLVHCVLCCAAVQLRPGETRTRCPVCGCEMTVAGEGGF